MTTLLRPPAVLFSTLFNLLLVSSAQGQLLDPFDFASVGTWDTFGGSYTIDTDALTITGADGGGIPVNFTGVVDDQNGMASPGAVPEIAVFTFDSISIRRNMSQVPSVTVVGSRALALLSHGDANVEGTVHLIGADATSGNGGSGQPGAGGPGGFAGGDQGQSGFGPGGGGLGTSPPIRGGGGGFGSDGGHGTPSDNAGPSYGDLSGLLQGGSGGGGTTDPFFPAVGASGGGGGGAIEIGAVGHLTLGRFGAVSIVANGGTGGSDSSLSDSVGGNGSGGGIRLHGTTLDIPATSTIEAKGTDAGSGPTGGGGRVLLSGITSLPFAVGVSTIDPAIVTANIDVSGGDPSLNHGVVTIAPPLVLVPADESVVFGQASIIQAASTTQPAVDLFVINDVQVLPGGRAIVPTGGYTNHKVIELRGGNARITGSDPLRNRRRIEGAGRIETTVLNEAGGNISVSVDEQLTITGSGNTNDGDLSVVGGTLIVNQDLTNNAIGRINAINSTLTFNGGLTNHGELNLINSSFNGSVAASGSSSTLVGSNSVSGNYAMSSGDALFIDIAGTMPGEFDTLDIGGDAHISGNLNVAVDAAFVPMAGDSFDIVTIGGSTSGAFADLAEGGLVGDFGGTDLFITYQGGDGNDVALFAGLPGDFNGDGTVDAADYVVWRKNNGTPAGYETWRTHFGVTAGSGSLSSNTTVPEPASALLLVLGAAVGSWTGRLIYLQRGTNC